MGSAAEEGVSEESTLGISTLEEKEVILIWEQGKGLQKSKEGRQKSATYYYSYHRRFIPAYRLTSLPPIYASRHFLTVHVYFDVSSDYTLVFTTLPSILFFRLSIFAGSY